MGSESLLLNRKGIGTFLAISKKIEAFSIISAGLLGKQHRRHKEHKNRLFELDHKRRKLHKEHIVFDRKISDFKLFFTWFWLVQLRNIETQRSFIRIRT